MKQKTLLVVFGVMVLMIGLLAVHCETGSAAQAAKNPIKLGVFADFTGPMAFSGQPVLDGVKMRLEEANYQAAGRKVELVVEDSATDSSICLEKAKKMVERDNVSFIIELITPVAIEKELRFAIREGGRTVGAGVVTEILE